MKSVIFLAIGFACAASGCKLGGDKSGPGANGETATGESFAGRYRSTWGDTMFAQSGSRVTASYPAGTLDCTASGKVLDCSWKEGSMTGHAKLTKQADNSLDGTWGNGPSATAGGRWLFTPLELFGQQGVAIPSGGVTFTGTYRSTWGDTVFTQAGNIVNAKYPGGTMACNVTGSTLDCTWKEGGSYGKARLTKQPGGTIAGTWGNGANERDGGQWTFAPK